LVKEGRSRRSVVNKILDIHSQRFVRELAGMVFIRELKKAGYVLLPSNRCADAQLQELRGCGSDVVFRGGGSTGNRMAASGGQKWSDAGLLPAGPHQPRKSRRRRQTQTPNFRNFRLGGGRFRR
jgi:hypothetical protein